MVQIPNIGQFNLFGKIKQSISIIIHGKDIQYIGQTPKKQHVLVDGALYWYDDTGGDVMVEWMRPWTLILEIHGSNPQYWYDILEELSWLSG